jgi:hypothetical protein
MDMEEAPGYVFTALRQPNCDQYQNLLIAVGDLKASTRNLQVDPTRMFHLDGRQHLGGAEKALILEIVWSLIVQGILIPGVEDGNQGWPHFRLTIYGRKCIEADHILPHDPDGFLAQFRGDAPHIDPTVLEYLTESLQCFVHGLQRAAAVMLGGASEQAILLMIESFGNSISDTSNKQKFVTSFAKTQSIFKKYELFEKHLPTIKERLPRELAENIDSQLKGVFDLIRNSRNDAGHPAMGSGVNRDGVYSHLRLFTPYYKRINALTAWFAANPT